MRVKKLIFFLFFFPSVCFGIDVRPWINNEYEMEFRSELLYQNYDSIQTPSHKYKRQENDYFWTFSAAYPFRRFRGEFEITLAHTHHQNRRIDNYRLSMGYLWKDDTVGDDFSFMTGFIFTEPMTRALHDVSSFHHGHFNPEFFLSFGKRIGPCCSKDYIFRFWDVFSIGSSDVGSGWIREDIALEFKNYAQFCRVFTNTLWGLGRHDLDLTCFNGYGKIRHQSVDVGIRYGYCFDCFGTLSIQYARRVYAHNFPENANLILIEYYLPLGSQDPFVY